MLILVKLVLPMALVSKIYNLAIFVVNEYVDMIFYRRLIANCNKSVIHVCYKKLPFFLFCLHFWLECIPTSASLIFFFAFRDFLRGVRCALVQERFWTRDFFMMFQIQFVFNLSNSMLESLLESSYRQIKMVPIQKLFLLYFKFNVLFCLIIHKNCLWYHRKLILQINFTSRLIMVKMFCFAHKCASSLMIPFFLVVL